MKKTFIYSIIVINIVTMLLPNISQASMIMVLAMTMSACLIAQMNHMLPSLLTLEMLTLTVYLMFTLESLVSAQAVILMIFMVINVCEAVTGIGVVIASARSAFKLNLNSWH